MLELIFAVIWSLISIIATIGVFLDARKRGSSGVLWCVIVLILGLLGLWFVVRPAIIQLPPPL